MARPVARAARMPKMRVVFIENLGFEVFRPNQR
jgi:hypothetical protein